MGGDLSIVAPRDLHAVKSALLDEVQVEMVSDTNYNITTYIMHT